MVQINYGGRVTDDNDRRLLMSLLGRCYSPEALVEGHTWTPASGTYRVPHHGPHPTPQSSHGGHAPYVDAYLAHLRAFPQRDEPEVFGLHANANITFNLQV